MDSPESIQSIKLFQASCAIEINSSLRIVCRHERHFRLIWCVGEGMTSGEPSHKHGVSAEYVWKETQIPNAPQMWWQTIACRRSRPKNIYRVYDTRTQRELSDELTEEVWRALLKDELFLRILASDVFGLPPNSKLFSIAPGAKIELIRSGGAPPVSGAPTYVENSETSGAKIQNEVLRYLHDLANDCAELPYYFPQHLRDDGSDKTAFDSIHQTVRVVEDRRAFEGWLAGERERRSREGFDLDGLAYSPSRGIPEEKGERGRRKASVETIPWDERAGRRFHRAAILGDPGFGKSWLLRYEARRLARRAIDGLMSGTASVDDIDLPVLLRLSDLASGDDALENAFVTLLGQGYSSDFRHYLCRQLTSNHGIVLLDAWDEISDLHRRRKLKERIHTFAGRHPTRILLTSRIVCYDLTQPPLPEGKELELLAWNWQQVASFVGAWFRPKAQRAKRFLNKLKQHQQFRGLARIPLMLELLCQACPEGDLPSRRSDLYRDCLWGLLRDWHIHDKDHTTKYTRIQLSDGYIGGLIEALEYLSSELHKERIQQFEEDRICLAVESFLNTLYGDRPSHEFNREQISRVDLVDRFKNDGILISATGVGRELRFLHLTFQEYLAARALAKRRNCIEEALNHVYDPAWHQVLAMLGAVLEKPGPWIAALLRKNREDLFCRPFLLAIHAFAEADRERLPKELSNALAEEVTSLRLSASTSFLWNVAERAIRNLPAAVERTIALICGRGDLAVAADTLGETGFEQAVPALLDMLRDKDEWVRYSAAGALGRMGSEQGVSDLLEVLREDDDDDVRAEVAKALGRIGSERAVPALLEVLRGEKDEVRDCAAGALAKIGSEGAVLGLLQLLRDKDRFTRGYAAEVLGKTGSEQAVPALLDMLGDEDEGTRARAAEALGTIGSERAVPGLLRLVRFRIGYDQKCAIWALGRLGSERAVPTLLELVQDESESVCKNAAEALAMIGSKGVVSGLLQLVRDKDRLTRAYAAEALGKIGSEQAVPDLLEVLRDKDEWVRGRAAWALGQIGSKEAVPVLIGMLRDKDLGPRARAAEALGTIGSERAVPGLLRLVRDRSEYDQGFAIRALGQLGSKEAVPVLLEMLGEKWVLWSELATEALGRIGSEEAVPVLIGMLRSTRLSAAQHAAEALGRIGSERAVPALLAALKNDDRQVHEAATNALHRISSKRAMPVAFQQMEAKVVSALPRIRIDTRYALQSLGASLDRLAGLCQIL